MNQKKLGRNLVIFNLEEYSSIIPNNSPKDIMSSLSSNVEEYFGLAGLID